MQTSRLDGPLLKALLDSAVDGIIVIDSAGKIVLFNYGAEKMFGRTWEDVEGKNVHVLMPEPFHSAHDGYMERYLATGERRIIGIGREVRAVNAAGEEFPIDLSVGEAPIDGESFFVGILRDLRVRANLEAQLRTEKQHVRQLERTIEHVHRTSTLGEMAAGIAHEINQPLSAISTYADASLRFLEREHVNRDKLGGALEKIGSQARRAGEVIKRMRALANPHGSTREVIPVNEIINDLLELAKLEAKETDAPIRLDLADDLPPVRVDTVQVQQVLLNLIRNGLEAMVKRSQSDAGLRIETRLDGDWVAVCVADHGMGVAPDKAEDIFHPFETSKPGGLGMGLSICSTIIRNHGGRLWYEPNENGGSQFWFTLPVADAPRLSKESQ